MLILDSNIWIHALTRDRPVEVQTESLGTLELVEDLVSGEYRSLMTAYMAAEVERGCRRSDRLSSEEVDEALTRLYAMLGRCDSIRTPFDGEGLDGTTLSSQRTNPCNRLVGHLLDIQTKDVPILLPAYDHRSRDPVVLTADAEFADLVPEIHDLSEITVEGLVLAGPS